MPVVTPYQPIPGYLPRREVSAGVKVIAWIIAVLTGLYMLPWAIAATRNLANHGAIALINFLLGWTVIGWIVALVMACRAKKLDEA